ncbi:hypothetical protein [Micromonospora sp. WMMD714]|uniref:hypothetical protein n=1 Tax=Micromonospora sp. WMMD714 TaxID=3016097 RepID=UPI002499BD8A|nr:hypothetical protein [Micromonospora sp. WMMD714]WFE62621.1 hypothetical protein O7625_04650 [Micromonospora sp. WMMD714]
MIRTAPRRLAAGLTAGLLAATLVAPGVAMAAPRTDSVPACLMRPLPLPPGGSLAWDAMFVDPAGRFIVGTGRRATDQGQESLLLRWDGPRVTVLTRSPGLLVAVNRHGVLIGDSSTSTGNRPWRYRDGRVEWLPLPPTGIGGYVTAVNSRGDIVGYGGYLEEPVTLRWPVDRPDTVEVLEPGGLPVAVLDDGTIVGEVPGEEDRSSNGAGVGGAGGRGVAPPPVAWVRRPDGRVDRLTAPGAVKSTVSAARGNWAVGQVDDTADGQYEQMVRWDLRTGVATPVRPGLDYVTGVNAAGSLLAGPVVDHLDHRVPLRNATSDPVTRIATGAIADDGLVVGIAAGPEVSFPVRWSGC